MKKLLSVVKKIWSLWYGKVIIISTFLSFFTPFVFTQDAFSSCFVLAGKGEIGDAIGGIMGTAVALIGVGVTFLAFWIQKKANDNQVKQFNSIQRRQEDQKEANAKNWVELMLWDVNYMIEDLTKESGWIKRVESFQRCIDVNPYYTVPLSKTTLANYDRIRNVPRTELLVSLKELKFKNPSAILYSYYTIADSLGEVLKDVCEKTDLYSKDVYDNIVMISNNLTQGGTIPIVDAFYEVYKYNGYPKEISDFREACMEEFSKVGCGRYTDMNRVLKSFDRVYQYAKKESESCVADNSVVMKPVMPQMLNVLNCRMNILNMNKQQIDEIQKFISFCNKQIEGLKNLQDELTCGLRKD